MRTLRLSGWELVVRRRGEDAINGWPDLSTVVKTARLARGWSQEDLAREIDYSVRTVRRWEEGAQPRPRGLLALAGALDLDLSNWPPNQRRAA